MKIGGAGRGWLKTITTDKTATQERPKQSQLPTRMFVACLLHQPTLGLKFEQHMTERISNTSTGQTNAGRKATDPNSLPGTEWPGEIQARGTEVPRRIGWGDDEKMWIPGFKGTDEQNWALFFYNQQAGSDAFSQTCWRKGIWKNVNKNIRNPKLWNEFVLKIGKPQLVVIEMGKNCSNPLALGMPYFQTNPNAVHS